MAKKPIPAKRISAKRKQRGRKVLASLMKEFSPEVEVIRAEKEAANKLKAENDHRRYIRASALEALSKALDKLASIITP